MASRRPYQPRKYDVGAMLLTLRTRAKLTQIDLAKLVGVNRRSLQNWETGAAYPREPRLQQLIAVFLSHHAFAPGQERAEAESLWAQVSADAPHPFAVFDTAWFESLLTESQPAGGNRAQLQPPPTVEPPSSLVDWGEAIAVPALYGRDVELAKLTQWSLDDRCRLIGVLGLAGIGKTSLAITFAQQIAPLFDAVIFRSLRNAPPLSEVIDMLIRTVSAQQATPPDRLPDKIELLIRLFRERRCLVVLDNFESILQEGLLAGEYHRGYEGYGALLKRVGETMHRSCMLLTSREKPAELGLYEASIGPVRTLVLEGLDDVASKRLLAEKDIHSSEPAHSALTRLYAGNPLALKLVSEPIREVFGGDVIAFLAHGEPFFNGVGKVLAEEFTRSSPLEQSLLYALAIGRELISLDALESSLPSAPPRSVLQALESLRRRLLIEHSTGRPAFTLQPVIMEYVTDRLVETIAREITERQPDLLRQHALVQATAKDYVRRAQERLIGKSLLDRLGAAVTGASETEQLLLDLLGSWRGRSKAEQGYGPGNLVNLLRLLCGDLRGVDLSFLAIEQAYLQEYDGTVKVWDVSSGVCLATLAGHTGGIRGIAMTADGRLVASTSFDGTIRLWEANSGQPLALLRGQTGLIWSVALSRDGQILASGGMDASLRLWNTSNGQLVTRLEGQEGQLISVGLSEDGRFVASGERGGTIHIWDTGDRKLLATLRGHAGSVWSVALSADGAFVASGGYDETVRLWDTHSRQLIGTLTGHKGTVHSVALAPDGELVASGGRDGTVRLWERAHGTSLVVLQAHTGPVWSVAMSRDRRLVASGSEDGTIRLWQTKDGSPLATLQGHNGAVFGVGLDEEGRLVASSGMDGTIRLWRVSDGAELYAVRAHQGAIWGMAMSADGRLVAGGVRGGAVETWDASTGAAVGVLRPDRLYERMDITGLRGVTEAQRTALRALGAIENSANQ